MTPDLFREFAQFGVAGLMGVLWIWERLHSRRRENQLSEAHARLTDDREHLDVLIELVRQNTAAIERFDRTQTHLIELLERVSHDEQPHQAA